MGVVPTIPFRVRQSGPHTYLIEAPLPVLPSDLRAAPLEIPRGTLGELITTTTDGVGLECMCWRYSWLFNPYRLCGGESLPGRCYIMTASCRGRCAVATQSVMMYFLCKTRHDLLNRITPHPFESGPVSAHGSDHSCCVLLLCIFCL